MDTPAPVPAPTSDEPPIAPVRNLLDWLPTYLAVLAIHGHARALHVAKVTNGLVLIVQATHPAFARACLQLQDHRALKEKQARAVDPTFQAASAADLHHVDANSRAIAAISRSENGALLKLLAIVADAVGITDVEGLTLYEWFNRERRVQLDNFLLSIGDTDPEQAEYLQSIFAKLREQCARGSIAHPPED